MCMVRIGLGSVHLLLTTEKAIAGFPNVFADFSTVARSQVQVTGDNLETPM